MASTSAPSIQAPNVDDILQQAKVMQSTNLKMMKGMQDINMKNTLIQGMNNMFNAGIQTISQATASARDAFSAIGRNM
jgi:hypothetical protein